MPTQRGTLASVARAAGVSKQTVSNVLNSPDRVKKETQARVLEAIAALNYIPSPAARQLRTGRSQSIGMRLPPLGDGVSGVIQDRFLHAVTDHAQAAGYRITLFTAPDPTAEALAYDELRAVAKLDGFIVIGTEPGDVRVSWLIKNEVPFVTWGRQWDEGLAEHSWVDVDGAYGTRLATEHLLRQGHERVAFLGWPSDGGLGDDRRRGWREALDEVGRDGTFIPCVDDVQAARATVSELRRHEEVTAIVCASDSLALGAYESTLRSQSSLAIVGFDDTPVAAALGISSVAQPHVESAEAVFDSLRAQLEDDDTSAKNILLLPQLIIRNS